MKPGFSNLNLCMRTELVIPLKQYFAALSKGALSRQVEEEMARFLRKKRVVLDPALSDLWARKVAK